MNSIGKKIVTNWKSGLTVSLVSIPLSISLAVASGTTPIAGIITAIWAGLMASFFGGSNFNIFGPTGALSGIIAAYAIAHGAGTLPMLAVISGIFILVAFALKLERYLVFVPSSVIHGFTLGVAFIIGFGQFNAAFGIKGLEKHERFVSNLIESFTHLGKVSVAAAIVFMLFLAGLFVLRRLVPKVPGAIILSPIGILIGYLGVTGHLPFALDTLGNNYADLSGKLFLMPKFFFDMSLIGTGFTVALVAILETMLSAKIADGMTKTKHNGRKEMFGLGICNIASGLAGGIPATAALARTSLNIKSGADDKVSATVSSVAVALISLVFLTYFKYIPMSVIAAILVYVAIQMIEMEHFVTYYKFDKFGFWTAMLVGFVTVYEDPIVGILLGTAVALVLFMEKISHGRFDIFMNDIEKGQVGVISADDSEKLKEITENPDILLYSIKGVLVYINSRAHVTRFESNLIKYKTVIIRLREVHFMDLDGVEALDEIISLIKNKGQQVVLTGVSPWISGLLEENSHEYKKLKESGLVFDKATQALAYLGVNQGGAVAGTLAAAEI